MYDMPDATAPGQILVSFNAGDPSQFASWLSTGNPNQVLTVTNTGDIAWMDNVVGSTTLKDPIQKSQLLFSVGGGSVNAVHEWLAPGAPGQYLTINNTDDLAWADFPADADHMIPDATGRGQLLMALGAGDPHTTASGGQGRSTWLPLGTANQHLAVHPSGSGLQWVDEYNLPDATSPSQIFISTGAGDPSVTGSWLQRPQPNQFLASTATGALTWVNQPEGYDLPDAVARGQLFISTNPGDPSSNAAWLLPGTTGQVLQIDASGVPVWANATLTDTNSMIPAAFDKSQLLVSNGGGDPHTTASGGGGKSFWLSAGDPGEVLSIDATGDLFWMNAPGINATGTTSLPNPTTTGQILYATGAGDVNLESAWLQPGNVGDVLTTGPGGSLYWAPDVDEDNDHLIPESPSEQHLLYSTGSGDPHTGASGGGDNSAWLAPGINGQVLTIIGSDLSWSDLPEPAASIPDPTAANQLLLSTGGGPVDGNAQWTNPGTTGQLLTIDAGGNIVWQDAPITPDQNSQIPDAPGAAYVFTAIAPGDVHTTASGGGGNGQWLAPGAPGQSLIVNAAGTGLTWADAPDLPDPTDRGQIFYSTAGGDINDDTAWLPAGLPGQVLTNDATGNPYWTDIASSDHMIPIAPAPGYLLYSIKGGDPHTGASGGEDGSQWLAPGASGQLLAVNAAGTGFQWVDQVTPEVPYDLPDANTANQLFISNAPGDPSGSGSWLGRPAADQYLTSDATGNIFWAPKPTETVVTDTNYVIPNSPGEAYLFYSVGAGDPHTGASGGGDQGQWLAPGVDGQVLTLQGGRLTWGAQTPDIHAPDATAKGQLLVSTAAGQVDGVTQWLDAGLADEYLTVDNVGNLYWKPLPAQAANSDHLIPDAPALGYLLTSIGTGDPHTTASGGAGQSQWLAPGVQDQVLTIGPAGSPIWQDPAQWGETTLVNPTRSDAILYSTGAGEENDNHAWLEPGLPGEYLTIDNGGNLNWRDLPFTANTDHLIPDAPGAGSILTSIGAGDPHTTASDGGGQSQWLAPGAAGQQLVMNAAGTGLSWQDQPAGMTDTNWLIPDAPGAGSLLYSIGAGDPHTTASGGAGNSQWVPQGTPGQILTVSPAGLPTWQDCCYDLPDAPGVSLPFASGAGDPSDVQQYLTAGTAGQMLVVNAAGTGFTWEDQPVGATDTNYVIPDTPGTAYILTSVGQGDPHTVASGGGGQSNWLAPGNPGQLLSLNAAGTGFTWVDQAVVDVPYDLPDAATNNQILLSNGAGDPSGNSAWLAAPGANQVLSSDAAGNVTWAPKVENTDHLIPDAIAGALLTGIGNGDPHTTASGGAGQSQWLAPGTEGQTLTMVNGVPTWDDCCYDLPDASQAGQLFVSTGAGDPSDIGTWLNSPGVQQYLTTDIAGNFQWADIPAIADDTNYQIPVTGGALRLLTSNGNGDPHTVASGGGGFSEWLPGGTAGQILSINAAGTAFEWTDAPAAADAYDLPDATQPNQIFISVNGGDPSDIGTWLAAPTANQYLTTNAAGNLVWSQIVGDTDHKIPDAPGATYLLTSLGAGDPHTAVSGGGGQSNWLAPGNPGEVLSINAAGNAFEWTQPAEPYDLPDASIAGQLAYFSGAGDPQTTQQYLNPGTAGQVLTMNGAGNAPIWQDAAADTNWLIPPTTTGSILIGTGNGDPHTTASGGGGNSQWLQPGNVGQTLTINAAGEPEWSDCCYDLPDATAAGQLFISSGAGDPSDTGTWVAAPTVDQYLVTDGTGNVRWADIPDVATFTDTNSLIPETPGSAYILTSIGQGDPHTAASGGGGQSNWLAPGAANQILAINPTGDGFVWVNQATPEVPYDLPDAATNNQILLSNGAGDPSGNSAWLNAPSPDQVLSSDAAGNVTWAPKTENTDHLIPVAPGAAHILTSLGAGDPHTVASDGGGQSNWLAPGNPGEVLIMNAAGDGFEWTTAADAYDLPDSTAAGQLAYFSGVGDPSTTQTYLNPGTAGQVLSINATGTAPVWIDATENTDHKIPDTTAGSILIGIGAGDPHTTVSGGAGQSQWLQPGNIGQTLTINAAGEPEWSDCCYDLPDATAANQIFFSNAAGDPSATGTWLPAPNATQYLTTDANGNFQWSAIPTPTVDTNSLIPDAPATGALLFSTAAGDPHTTASGGAGASNWLAPGTEGQTLTIVNGAPVWQDCCYDLPDAPGISIPYMSGAGDPSDVQNYLNIGTAGQMLVINAAGTGFEWQDPLLDDVDSKIPDAPGPLHILTSTGAGDPHTAVSGGGGYSDWLAPGTAGQALVINVAGTGYDWADLPEPYDLPDSTAAGQLAIFNGAGDPQTTQSYLNPGTEGQTLTIVNGVPTWAECCYDLPDAPAAGAIAYFNAAGDPSDTQNYLAPGLPGQTLVLNAAGTAPEWVDATIDTNSLIPNAVVGGILTGTAAADPHTGASGGGDGSAWLAPGTDGQTLTIVNGAPEWADCCYDLPDATAANQIFISTGAGDPSLTGDWLDAGTPGQVLAVNLTGTGYEWVNGNTDHLIPDSPGVAYLLTSTAAGDPHTVASGGGDASTWLAPGTDGQVLTMNPTNDGFIWADAYTLPDSTLAGQIAIFNGAGDPSVTQTYLDPGTAGQTLTIDPVTLQPVWADCCYDLPDATAAGEIFIANAAGDPSATGEWLPPGTAGQVLTIDPVTLQPTWVNAGAGGILPDASVGGILYGTAVGNPDTVATGGVGSAWLAASTPGSVLIQNAAGDAPEWLPQGTAGQTLTVVDDGAGNLTTQWADCCYDLPDATAANQIFVSNAAGDPSLTGQWLAPGLPGQVLALNAAGDAYEWVTVNGGKLPDTAIGSILYGVGAGDPDTALTGGADAGAWLGIGTPGQVLTVNLAGTAPEWADQYTLPDSTLAGQIAIFNGAGDPSTTQTYLDPGTAGQTLTIDPVTLQPVWADCCYDLPDATAAGEIFIANAAGDPSTTGTWLAPGTAGQVLAVDPVTLQPTWVDAGAGGVLPDASVGGILYGTAIGNPDTVATGGVGSAWLPASTAGSVLIQNDAGTAPEWLPQGTAGQTLTIVDDGFGNLSTEWADCCYDLPDATAANQIFISNAAGDPSLTGQWLAPGLPGQVLALDATGTFYEWIDAAAPYNLPDPTATGDIAFFDLRNADTTATEPNDPSATQSYLNIGTEGQILSVVDDGTGVLLPQWADFCDAFKQMIGHDFQDDATACIPKANSTDPLDATVPSGLLGFGINPATGFRDPYWFQFSDYQPGLTIGRIPRENEGGSTNVALTPGQRLDMTAFVDIQNKGSGLTMNANGTWTVQATNYYRFVAGATINFKLRNLVAGGIWSATISLKVEPGDGSPAYEVRGTQISNTGDIPGSEAAGVDLTLYVESTNQFPAGSIITPRIHWFNGRNMGAETMDISFSRTNAVFSSGQQLPFNLHYITNFF